jgi:ectoine hydroxylase-related dioxygenase (phytanoyl-CoA dioxygenase family)
VYALLAKSPHFAELATHPLALAFAEAELGQSCLLSALLAINLHPGETVQPWHFDDAGARMPRPRPALGLSAFWAIDDTTELNGSTEVIPGSHLWDGQAVEGAATPADFSTRTTPNVGRDPGHRPDAIKMIMPSGSLAVPAELAEKLPERARELIGCSIHPPFMGHVDGVHPRRLLPGQARRERMKVEPT